MTDIYQGDNTGAFTQNFISITATIPEGFTISKAEFKCGSILLEFLEPTFPLIINLDETQTEKLSVSNTCYLAVYDELGQKQTCTGSLKVSTNARVV